VGKSNPMGAVDLRRLIRRLAPYRPGDYRASYVRRRIVLAAAHENGGGFESCKDCQEICQRLWGLDIELTEISTVIRRLVKNKYLSREGLTYRLTRLATDELAKRLRLSSEVEATAFEQWEDTVREIAPYLGVEQFAQLREDLITWLHGLIVEYGVEAALLLYPEQEINRQRLDEMGAFPLGGLPEREPGVMMVRRAALDAFVEFMTQEQREYFDNLIDTAYLMSIVTLDPKALQAVRQITKGQRLYLDSNVLYSIFKLNGPESYLASYRALEQSRSLGYQPCVTPWTVAEMKESVRRARTRLATQPSPQATAELIPDEADTEASDEAFIKRYRRMEREGGIDFNHFFTLHEDVESLLGKAHIAIVAIGCQAIEKDESRLGEEIAELEHVRQGPERALALQEHDVKHRLLIEYLRGEERRSLADALCLFLTKDYAVVRYGRAGRKHAAEVPFAMAFDEWRHIARSMSPRTENYERTMRNVLDTPALRGHELAAQRDVIAAIGRINDHGKHSATTLARALLNSAIRGSRSGEEPPENGEDPKAAAEARETALRTENAELRSELAAAREVHAAHSQASDARDRAARGEISGLHEELAAAHEALSTNEIAARAALDAERRKSGKLEKQVRKLRHDGHKRAKSDSQTASREKQTHDEQAALDARLKRLAGQVRWLVASLISVAGVVVLGVPLASGLITQGPLLYVDVGVGLAIPLGVAVWLYGIKSVWRYGLRGAAALIATAAAVVGTIVGVKTLVGSGSPVHRPQAPQQTLPSGSHTPSKRDAPSKQARSRDSRRRSTKKQPVRDPRRKSE
jgi:hypothetical protein